MKVHGPDGKEIRPDVSVGQRFSSWLKLFHPENVDRRRKYSHLLLDGKEVDAFQYPLDMLGLFITYVETVWMRDHAPKYLGDRDPAALEYLPRLLAPTSSPKAIKK